MENFVQWQGLFKHRKLAGFKPSLSKMAWEHCGPVKGMQEVGYSMLLLEGIFLYDYIDWFYTIHHTNKTKKKHSE